MGIVSELATSENLDTTVNKLAEKMAGRPKDSLGMMKHIMQKGMEMDLGSLIDREIEAQSLFWKTRDHREGLQAFIEKRVPIFNLKE